MLSGHLGLVTGEGGPFLLSGRVGASKSRQYYTDTRTCTCTHSTYSVLFFRPMSYNIYVYNEEWNNENKKKTCIH